MDIWIMKSNDHDADTSDNNITSNTKTPFMTQSSLSFGKKEKLCSLKLIQRLFSEGKSMVKYPLRVSQITLEELPENVNCQVLVSVSKKKFKRANKRNRIKRQIRETYRCNKHLLIDALQSCNKKMVLAFIYIPSEELSTVEIEKAMIKALLQLKENLEKIEEPNIQS